MPPMPPRARVQKRLYYKIGEACKSLGIQPYVLRYWETEFPALSPSKSRSGQRVYSERELEVIRRIKELLYDEGYTIAGAKKKLEAELASGGLGEPGGGELDASSDAAASAFGRPAEPSTRAPASPRVEPPPAAVDLAPAGSTDPRADTASRKPEASHAAGASRAAAAPRAPQSAAQGQAGRVEARAQATEARAARSHAAGAVETPPAPAPQAREEPQDLGEAHQPPPRALDTAAAQQIESLRTGIQEALAEARELLALLAAQSP